MSQWVCQFCSGLSFVWTLFVLLFVCTCYFLFYFVASSCVSVACSCFTCVQSPRPPCVFSLLAVQIFVPVSLHVPRYVFVLHLTIFVHISMPVSPFSHLSLDLLEFSFSTCLNLGPLDSSDCKCVYLLNCHQCTLLSASLHISACW